MAPAWLITSVCPTACELETQYILWLLLSLQFFWTRFVNWPKLGHEYDQQFCEDILYCVAYWVLKYLLKIGSPFFTAQHNQSVNVCIIHSWTSFELFFYRNILTIQCTTLENSTFPFIWFSQSSETNLKKKNCKNWHVGMRKILMVVDKIICRFWELGWECFSISHTFSLAF